MIPRVHLGFCYGTIYPPFMLSVLRWERYLVAHEGYLPSFTASKNLYIAQNRNKMVEQFLEQDNADWLWVLDTDIDFQPDTCARLLEVADPLDAPVVAAAYWQGYDEDGLALTWHADTASGLRLFRKLPKYDGPMEIGSCGMGCTLIHRSVFEALKDENDPWCWFGHDIIPGLPEPAGEDVHFCRRARKKGFRIVGHCGVTVEHFKPSYMPHGDFD